ESLATSSADETVRLWETSTGREVRVVSGHEHVHGLAFSPDGRVVALGGSRHDAGLVLVETATGKERTLGEHGAAVSAVAFRPAGKTVVAGGRDKTVRFWDVGTGKEQRRLDGLRGEVRALALSSDGQSLLTTTFDVENGEASLVFRLWDTATGKE